MGLELSPAVAAAVPAAVHAVVAALERFGVCPRVRSRSARALVECRRRGDSSADRRCRKYSAQHFDGPKSWVIAGCWFESNRRLHKPA